MQLYTEGWKSMGFKQFSLRIIARTIAAMVTLVLLTIAVTTSGYHAATILLVVLLISQFIELVNFVSKTNNELVRFFDAARYADFSQRFDLSNVGAGFEELGHAFTDILTRLQKARTAQVTELKHLKAVVEHVPVPLISLNQESQITLWNNSARRLFGTTPVIRLNDLAQFGSHFPEQIKTMQAGERQLIKLNIDGIEHQLTVAATEIRLAQQQELLFSLQDIQNELVSAQLQAWQDLVSVLTHEIMNSITPVASLASTAVDLVDDIIKDIAQQPADKKDISSQELSADLRDVTDAVTTVARRSKGLMTFVDSYRRLTRLPTPNKNTTSVRFLSQQVIDISCQHWSAQNLAISCNISPESLDINVDQDMLSQILINLLKNAEQATEGCEIRKVELNAFINKRGHPVIEVNDNGCGMSKEIADNAFVPFYTTKRDGSGVGLALTRQIMLAHGGHVTLDSKINKGTSIRLIF